MKLSYKSLILALALLASFSTAQAQLITKTFDVTGVSNGVTARFTLWINLDANTLVVNINNALPTSNSGKVGTITGIGFNTPFLIASQNNDNPGSVVFAAKWTNVNSGHTGVPTAWPVGSSQIKSADDYWNESSPWSLNPSYNQDYGVTAPNPNYGIEYGENATFSFKFSQDINLANIAGFFDNNSSTTNKFDFSVRWQEVDTKWNYVNNCFNGPGSDKGGIDLTFTADGDLPATPEPSTYGLMGAAALLGLAAHRRRKAAKAAKAA